jgi:hypothetical protein
LASCPVGQAAQSSAYFSLREEAVWAHPSTDPVVKLCVPAT